jgi:hypothetical protein
LHKVSLFRELVNPGEQRRALVELPILWDMPIHIA